MTPEQEQLVTPEEAEVVYRFEPGLPLKGDLEGLKISNYQIAGEHAARRMKSVTEDKPVLEVCTGIGTTTFVLARNFPQVYGIERSPQRFAICRSNLERLGLADKVELVNADALDEVVLELLSRKGIGAVYTDVDWTLSDNWQDHTSDITQTSPNTADLYAKISSLITPNIVMKLPKTINLTQLRELANCEVEEIKPDGKLSFYLVYFGDLVSQETSQFTFPKHYYS